MKWIALYSTSNILERIIMGSSQLYMKVEYEDNVGVVVMKWIYFWDESRSHFINAMFPE